MGPIVHSLAGPATCKLKGEPIGLAHGPGHSSVLGQCAGVQARAAQVSALAAQPSVSARKPDSNFVAVHDGPHEIS